MSMRQDIEYAERDGVAVITISRPQVMNALSPVTVREIAEAVIEFDEAEHLSVCVITGAGDASFCAGADLKWADSHPDEWEAAQQNIERALSSWFRRTHTVLGGDLPAEVWKPLIAAVNGYCLGGGLEMAMQCDLVVASETATFGFPEVVRGWVPGAGGVFFATRNLPLKAAMEMLLTGEPISAHRAYELGLVNRVVPPERLMDEALGLAARISANSPLAVQCAKELAMKGLDVPLNYPPHAWQVMESSDMLRKVRAASEEKRRAFAGRESKRGPGAKDR